MSERVNCALACRCGARKTVALPVDRPAREVLADVRCPECGRSGAMFVTTPASLPPDHEGDEELLERRGRMRAGWSER